MAFEGINWGLAAPVNVGGAFQDGWQRGQALRQETDTRNALGAFAKGPSMETANALIAVDPRLGMQARQQQIEQDRNAQLRTVTQRAAGGDHAALTELAGLDPELWMKFDKNTQEKVKQATGFMGQAVLDVSRLPEDQRAQHWASMVQHAEASGLDIPTQYERYSPEALNAAAAEAGTMDKLIQQFEPDYQAVPQGGGLVNTRDPNAVQQWNSQVSSGASAVPPPPPGFQLDDGGPTPSASGTFRP